MGAGMFWRRREQKTEPVETEDTKLDKALLENRTLWRFRRVRNRILKTLEGDDYRSILEDPEKWDKLVVQMDAYFKHRIDLFPYVEGGSNATRVVCPSRFYAIERDEIETCFPGGHRSGEPGDFDLRNLLKGLQRSFTHNLARYYIIKRLGEAAVVLALVTLFMMFRNGVTMLSIFECFLNEENIIQCIKDAKPMMNGSAFFLFSVVIAIISAFHNWLNTSLHFCLESTLDSSSLFVDGQVAIRTKNLTNLIDDIVPRIDDDRLYLEKSGNEQDWPERSKKWTILIYWLAKRLEYIERYAQIEIWLMRRSHYWLQYGARIAYRLIVSSFIVAMPVVAYVTLHDQSLNRLTQQVWVYIGYFVVFAAGLWTLHRSFTAWNTPLTLIADKLQPINWKRYCDVHLQEKLADQIVHDQRAILQKDAQLAG